MPTDETLLALSDFIREECTEPGRILVQNWGVGEYLYWATDSPVIGGFPDRRLIHEAANLFRRPSVDLLRPRKLADYLERYNVRYIVLTYPVPVLERQTQLVEFVRLVGPHRVYRTLHGGGYFLRGSGEVKAGLNRIEITGARPHPKTEELTLSFHFMGTLRCRPDCRVSRAPIPDDPAGFITLTGDPALARDLVVEHVY